MKRKVTPKAAKIKAMGDAATKPTGGLDKSAGKGKVKPTQRSDLKLRLRHSKDTIRYNASHARDHIKELAAAEKRVVETKKKLRGKSNGTS